jgi:hypothetical protein
MALSIAGPTTGHPSNSRTAVVYGAYSPGSGRAILLIAAGNNQPPRMPPKNRAVIKSGALQPQLLKWVARVLVTTTESSHLQTAEHLALSLWSGRQAR